MQSVIFEILKVLLIFSIGWYFSYKTKTLSKKQLPEILPEKDPLDFSLTSSSTEWKLDQHHCKECKASVGHEEYMSDVCNTCGSFKCMDLMGRIYRKIFIDGKWKYQIKYRNGDMEIIDKWYHSK